MATKAVTNLVPGGSAAGGTLGYRLLTERGVSPPAAGFTLATVGLGSAVVLNAMLWLALLVSIPLNGFNPLYGTAAIVGLFLMLAMAGLVLLLMKGGSKAERLFRAIARKIPFVNAVTVSRVVYQVADRLHELMSQPRLIRRGLLWAAINWVLDAAALWVFLRAFGGDGEPGQPHRGVRSGQRAGRHPDHAGRPRRRRGGAHPDAHRIRAHPQRRHHRRPGLPLRPVLVAHPARRDRLRVAQDRATLASTPDGRASRARQPHRNGRQQAGVGPGHRPGTSGSRHRGTGARGRPGTGARGPPGTGADRNRRPRPARNQHRRRRTTNAPEPPSPTSVASRRATINIAMPIEPPRTSQRRPPTSTADPAPTFEIRSSRCRPARCANKNDGMTGRPRSRGSRFALAVGGVVIGGVVLGGCQLPRFGAPKPATRQAEHVLALWQGTVIAAAGGRRCRVGRSSSGPSSATGAATTTSRARSRTTSRSRSSTRSCPIAHRGRPVLLHPAHPAARSTASPSDPDVTVEVIGFQWQWQFRYPGERRHRSPATAPGDRPRWCCRSASTVRLRARDRRREPLVLGAAVPVQARPHPGRPQPDRRRRHRRPGTFVGPLRRVLRARPLAHELRRPGGRAGRVRALVGASSATGGADDRHRRAPGRRRRHPRPQPRRGHRAARLAHHHRPQEDRPQLHGDGLRLLHARRRARRDHPGPAVVSPNEQLRQPRHLQPGLHDARQHHDVPVHRPVRLRARQLHRAAADRRARRWRSPASTRSAYWLYLFGGLTMVSGFLTADGAGRLRLDRLRAAVERHPLARRRRRPVAARHRAHRPGERAQRR